MTDTGTGSGSGAIDPDPDDPDDPEEYRLPPNHELQRLLGFDDIDDDDRAELLDLAYWQALLLDRLDALGVLRRDADLVELTTLGTILLRAALMEAGFETPTTAEMVAADADRLLELIESWPRRVRFEGLRDWLQARQDTDTAWKELLQMQKRRWQQSRRLLLVSVKI